jgi:hypothetical protein
MLEFGWHLYINGYGMDGWRATMVGSISFYDIEEERLHTCYVSYPPEHGKASFYKMFTRTQVVSGKVMYWDGGRGNG